MGTSLILLQLCQQMHQVMLRAPVVVSTHIGRVAMAHVEEAHPACFTTTNAIAGRTLTAAQVDLSKHASRNALQLFTTRVQRSVATDAPRQWWCKIRFLIDLSAMSWFFMDLI